MNRRIFFEGANLSYRGQLSIFGPKKGDFWRLFLWKQHFLWFWNQAPQSLIWVNCMFSVADRLSPSSPIILRFGPGGWPVCTLFLNFKLLGWDKQKEEYTWPLPLISAIRYYHTIVNYPKITNFLKFHF